MSKAVELFIQKSEFKKADAFRINGPDDIPEHLKNAISISDGKVVMENAETGKSTAELGQIIRFEESDNPNCPSGFNSWPISKEDEGKRFVEKDGVIYQKPVPTRAMPIEDHVMPEWMAGANVTTTEEERDGKTVLVQSLETPWGVSKGVQGEAYFVRYGTTADGKPDCNILSTSEKSFDAYEVCTKDGERICSLREFDDTYKAILEKESDVTKAVEKAYTRVSMANKYENSAVFEDACKEGNMFSGAKDLENVPKMSEGNGEMTDERIAELNDLLQNDPYDDGGGFNL